MRHKCVEGRIRPEYPTQYLFNFAGYLHATYLHFRFNLLIPRKKNRGFEKVSRLPRTSEFYNLLQLLSSVWIFLGSPGTTCIFRNHAWNLQRGSLFVQTKYEKCYYERPTPTLHKREHIAGILFHVLENKRSCGPKWETMRNNEAQSGPMNSK